MEMKKERSQMEKEVDVLENNIKVLSLEDEKLKKNILRTVKEREENLKIQDEVAAQKNEILKAKMEQNKALKNNMLKLAKLRENIRDTLSNFREKVKKKNIKKYENTINDRHEKEQFINTMKAESYLERHKKAEKIVLEI